MDDGNPNWVAERVSEDVDYSSWLDTAFTPTPPFNPCLNTGDVNDDGSSQPGMHSWHS